jgi:uncharacterized protein (TIGR02452 family)
MTNRNTRAQIARETVAICDSGFYVSPNGTRVDISRELALARKGTILYSPKNPARVKEISQCTRTKFEVKNETTFHALARLAAPGPGHLACLNFASAKNAGGGFLNGSLAQEEALACASGLYPCLLTAPEYYESNRANRSALYLDMAIFSPLVPFFRDDDGELLEKPLLASIITAPAPNAGAIAQNEPRDSHLVEPTLRRRADLVLSIAASQKVDTLVLGAWGCGVFRNDPRIVAGIFADLLNNSGKFARAFNQIVFAVFDRSDTVNTFNAFAEEFEKAK